MEELRLCIKLKFYNQWAKLTEEGKKESQGDKTIKQRGKGKSLNKCGGSGNEEKGTN